MTVYERTWRYVGREWLALNVQTQVLRVYADFWRFVITSTTEPAGAVSDAEAQVLPKLKALPNVERLRSTLRQLLV